MNKLMVVLFCIAGQETQSENDPLVAFSRRHPLASWFGSMLLCFADLILASVLTAEPILLLSLKCWPKCLLTATLIWYIR